MEEKFKQKSSTCIKVVLFGPESTGKTTLSRQLARYYDTLWVPEFARDYLQNKWDKEQKPCEVEDLLPIAAGQIKLENEYALKANKVLICDTDLLETRVYSETFYNGYCHPMLKKYSLENTYNLYFLTNIDVPWEADDLRDRPMQRKEMFEAFKSALDNNHRPYVLLEGGTQERFQKAVKHIDKLNKESNVF